MQADHAEILQALKRYWGFDGFLPLQREAMECVLAGRDSVVVLPTGGGKSLCFQAPAAVLPGLAIIVSPLISLMKDQVDGLTECGLPAERLDSSLTTARKADVMRRAKKGEIKLLYLSPERVITGGFIDQLDDLDVSFVAIDEAHCVSMWGHDFRPEYRALGRFKEARPELCLHAYTATATEKVRRDIAETLHLDDPAFLVGSFDRPNLVFKARKRDKVLDQLLGVIGRHENESGIVYCIRRADVDRIVDQLRERGHRALPYHAGLPDQERKKNQEAFIREEADIIVATIAFGMGIDKSNVRFVVHTGMPKSLENYQQESGRAGRDGLEAECTLFYSGGDYGVWRGIITDSEPQAAEVNLEKLAEMYQYCTSVLCRHRALSEYFGQQLDTPPEGCGACDVCLGELDAIEDALVTAQKILSCVLRLKQAFGGDYTAQVLIGSKDARILQNRHDELSTYGLLAEHTKKTVRAWIEQLFAQGFLEKDPHYATLSVTPPGWEVVRGNHTPTLLKPARPRRTRAKSRAKPVPGMEERAYDTGLFEKLRALRREIAREKEVPAFVVFGDRSLADMAAQKPGSIGEFLEVHGVGEKKAEEYGERFLDVIRTHGEGP